MSSMLLPCFRRQISGGMIEMGELNAFTLFYMSRNRCSSVFVMGRDECSKSLMLSLLICLSARLACQGLVYTNDFRLTTFFNITVRYHDTHHYPIVITKHICCLQGLLKGVA